MHTFKRTLSHRPRIDKEERYTKFQIALQYLPNLDPDTASRTLRRWIHNDPPLLTALRRMGYHTSQKYFTLSQVEILREYLGEP